MIEVIQPKDEKHWLELRSQDVTSTEVSALFGLSPYCTEFELWHRHKGNVNVEFEATERTQWGNRLQDAIALGMADDNKWRIRKMSEYIRNPQLRMGASFDFEYCDPSTGETGILEIKNVDGLQFAKTWFQDDDTKELEAPPHIELQVQHQLALTKKKFARIGALVGGNKLQTIKREASQDIEHEIASRIFYFWESIQLNRPPEPDFARDAEFLAKHIYNFAEPGKHVDARGDQRIFDLATQYKAFGDAEKQAIEQKKALKAQILAMIGDAEKVTADGFSITAGITNESFVEAHTRASFRGFRINWKKAK